MESLELYLKEVLSKYPTDMDLAHNITHIYNVTKHAQHLAKILMYKNENLIMTMATFHDIGSSIDRKNHNIVGRDIVLNDKILPKYFTRDEIELIALAVFEHRGKSEQSCLESKILFDADKLDGLCDVYRMIERCILAEIDTINDVEFNLNKCYDVLMAFLDKFEFKLDISNTIKDEEGINYIRESKDNFKEIYDKVRKDILLKRIN